MANDGDELAIGAAGMHISHHKKEAEEDEWQLVPELPAAMSAPMFASYFKVEVVLSWRPTSPNDFESSFTSFPFLGLELKMVRNSTSPPQMALVAREIRELQHGRLISAVFHITSKSCVLVQIEC